MAREPSPREQKDAAKRAKEIKNNENSVLNDAGKRRKIPETKRTTQDKQVIEVADDIIDRRGW